MWISWCHWQNYLSYYKPSRVWQVSYHIHLAALSPSYWTYYVDEDDVTGVLYVRYETNVRIYSYWGANVNKELRCCWVDPVGGARALNNEMRFISDCIGWWNALVIVIFCSIRTLYSSNVSFTKPLYVLKFWLTISVTFVTQEKIRQTRIHSPQDDRKNYHKTLIFKLKRSNFLKLQILKRFESNKRKDCWASWPNFSSSKIF